MEDVVKELHAISSSLAGIKFIVDCYAGLTLGAIIGGFLWGSR